MLIHLLSPFLVCVGILASSDVASNNGNATIGADISFVDGSGLQGCMSCCSYKGSLTTSSSRTQTLEMTTTSTTTTTSTATSTTLGNSTTTTMTSTTTTSSTTTATGTAEVLAKIGAAVSLSEH